jgi:hypothetical protein
VKPAVQSRGKETSVRLVRDAGTGYDGLDTMIAPPSVGLGKQ